MTIATNSNVPGLPLPKITGSQGPPGQAAINARTAMINKQTALNAVGGKKRGGAFTVPQMPGDTSGANNVIAKNAGNFLQASANAKYDNKLYSGGKKRTKKRSTRRTRRTRRTMRTRRNRK